jgi:hypothetical protein
MQNPFSSPPAFGDPNRDARFSHTQYSIKRKLLQAFGATFYLYDANENLILWAEQKAFKLKEDLRLYADDQKTRELLRISARSIMDFSAAYDVYDSTTNEKIGAFKRKGLQSSFVQDTWVLMDNNDREIGQIQEDSAILGLIRRFVDLATLFLPQRYDMTLNGQPVAQYKRVKNPFSSKLDIDFSSDTNGILDRRLALALAILLEAIEGKQG